MKLEEIGFYTLSDKRAKNTNATSPMMRGEIIITERCNFHCPYCRDLRKDIRGELNTERVKEIIDLWASQNLRNIRFSGGEPTIHPGILQVVEHAKECGVERIAISTNGSSHPDLYRDLLKAGVNDFSISLDACCAATGDILSGIVGSYDKVVKNILMLSGLTYVTIGIVLTDENARDMVQTVKFAHLLGVSDIRIISAAQENKLIEGVAEIPSEILEVHPILRYRVNNILKGRNVRGLQATDCKRCYLVQDDSAIAGDYHFPCIIYMREHGDPIGKVGETMRQDRIAWVEEHNSFDDPICSKNCLDVCIDFNNMIEEMKEK